MTDTLRYATQNFGPMKASNLRLVPANYAFPATGYALPQTIFVAEDVGYHVDLEYEYGFDHLYRRTAHETAHQWWGHGLNGAATEGEGVLIESLAKYTEAMLLGAKYGDQYVRKLIEFEHGRYLFGRNRSLHQELPLYRADEPYLIYSKGAAALYAITQMLGEKHVNTALTNLVSAHRYPAVPATTLDLISYLLADTNPQQAKFIKQWFFDINVHDVAISEVGVTQQSDHYLVTVCLVSTQDEVNRVEIQFTDVSGRVTDEFVMAFEPAEAQTQCAQRRVKAYPTYVEVDPRLLILDSDRSNNHYTVL